MRNSALTMGNQAELCRLHLDAGPISHMLFLQIQTGGEGQVPQFLSLA